MMMRPAAESRVAERRENSDRMSGKTIERDMVFFGGGGGGGCGGGGEIDVIVSVYFCMD
ncbi:conserved hypothetical protein [Ricinus communis]|uniref:Uncharacterized protein n=1 Tax=Ricinus communis TaxID=3988 RepID=B9T8G4_RICCO|nr:conserved hypothetical protein [Ricinus communis]